MSGALGRLKLFLNWPGRTESRPPSPLIPDQPVPFGYKQVWLAVKTEGSLAVAEALNLQEPRPSTWAEGIERSYEYSRRHRRTQCFITPPIQGWTLAVGGIKSFPAVGDSKWLLWLAGLSERLGHVQYYGTHRVVEFHAWAKAEQGRIIRAYGYSGETLANVGERTPEEIELGFDFFDETRASESEIEAFWAKINEGGPEVETRGCPDEESVMSMAERWSLDPTRLDEYESGPGLGLIGTIRVQRGAG